MAQAISILSSPIITRLYSPEAIGLFASFMALVTSLAPAVTGRFEVALMLPEQQRVARELFAIAVWICALVCSTLFVAFFLFRDPFLATLSLTALEGWLLIAPLTLLFTGLFNLVGYVANRQNGYGLIARASVIQAATIALVNVVLGLAGADFRGLIVGNLAGVGLALLVIVATQRDFIDGVVLRWSLRKKALLRRYKDFPLFNASTSLLVGVTTNLPIFIMIAFFPAEIAGFYALVIRVLNAPVAVISHAVSRVNLKEVVELLRTGGNIERHLLRTTAALLAVSVPPAAIFVIWGPDLFALIFGARWERAGEIAQVLAYALVVRFVSTTLSTTLGATNNNRYTAAWRITAFISTIAVLYVAAQQGSVDTFLVALVANEIALYLLYYVLIIRAARHPKPS